MGTVPSSKAYESLDDMNAAWMDEGMAIISDNEEDKEDSNTFQDLITSKPEEGNKIELQLDSPSESIEQAVSVDKEDTTQKEAKKGVVGLREVLMIAPEESYSQLTQQPNSFKDKQSPVVEFQED